jgi:hypothetical protein
MKRDLLISLASNLTYEDLKPWVESFSSVNFSAEKVILLFNADKKTIKKLNESDFKIISVSEQNRDGSLSYNPTATHMNVERFLHFWNFLRTIKDEYRYIISCDSRDIIFQRDPFEWLDIILSRNADVNFVASAEPCLYKDETFWGAQNFYHSFGPVAFDHIKDRMIYNAGTIAGRASHIADLFASIYFMSINNRVSNPDQAAYNFLLSLEPYKKMTHFSSSEEDFAAQVGILMHPQFDDKRLEPKPIWDGEYLYTQNKNRYCIVHQYDRDPNLLSHVNKKYGVNISGH